VAVQHKDFSQSSVTLLTLSGIVSPCPDSKWPKSRFTDKPLTGAPTVHRKSMKRAEREAAGIRAIIDTSPALPTVSQRIETSISFCSQRLDDRVASRKLRPHGASPLPASIYIGIEFSWTPD